MTGGDDVITGSEGIEDALDTSIYRTPGEPYYWIPAFSFLMLKSTGDDIGCLSGL